MEKSTISWVCDKKNGHVTVTVYDINACDITAIVLCDIQLPVDINTYDIQRKSPCANCNITCIYICV